MGTSCWEWFELHYSAPSLHCGLNFMDSRLRGFFVIDIFVVIDIYGTNIEDLLEKSRKLNHKNFP